MAEIGKDIDKARTLLEAGEVVAIPTETVYGLAGNALDVEAVTKIFKVKDRPYFDPLIVHVPDAKAVYQYAANIPHQAVALFEKFWPGPLTVLLEKKNIIPDLVTSGLDRVGLRCPQHPLTTELLQRLPFPLAAPSANPFGYISPTKPEHVNDQLGNKIKYILDGGECKVGIESTIVGFEQGMPVIYRVGGLAVDQIETVIGKVQVKESSSNPQSPGQLQSHYAPRKQMVVGVIPELLQEFSHQTLGVLSFRTMYQSDAIKKQIILSPTGDVEEAAQKFFSSLRELDRSQVDLIIAEEVPAAGLGRAINDRLKRASSKK
ncbi:MAG: threonylcarbamoyl-AMP synthase [Bacteroidetes bacterium]|nr:threonylcarbamoyl-AMP synthase [Bacteroidota bacterium]MBS1541619.1 threonylcarbamoyl-AMP synthase [Bacteroidota bacterium]